MTIRVAYQGERGAFSEAAARRLLGPGIEPLPYPTFDDMFAAVASSEAECCIAPIENSLAGSIHRNYDLMLESSLTIVAETYLRIVHHLIAAGHVPSDAIRRVYSHPVALAQCTRFLRANPAMEVVPAHDTAGAVREVMARGRDDEAAIASADAAEIYGAKIVAAEIEDHEQNYTRFLLLAPDGHQVPTGAAAKRWKTSLVFRTANKPGTLFRALGAFARFELDLAKIESRPIEGRPWEYAFYLDVIGRSDDSNVAAALDDLAPMCEMVRVLGSYPAVELLSS